MKDMEFDFGEGEAEAREGMANAARAGRTIRWRHDAGHWFMQLPIGTKFSADDLTRNVGLPDTGVNKNNVVGSFFHELAMQRFIQKTGETMKSVRIKRHTGMNHIWIRIK